MENALKLIGLSWNGLKHVWDPVTGWPFAGNKKLNDDLLSNAQIVVTMRRRNLLKQFVSTQISKSLGIWLGTGREFKEHLDRACLQPISIEGARKNIAEMSASIEQRDEFLRTLGAKQIVLYYEDVFESGNSLLEKVRFCNWLFQQLGHRPIDSDEFTVQCNENFSSKYKWCDRDVYERIPGIRSLDAEIGGDLTGRLFD